MGFAFNTLTSSEGKSLFRCRPEIGVPDLCIGSECTAIVKQFQPDVVRAQFMVKRLQRHKASTYFSRVDVAFGLEVPGSQLVGRMEVGVQDTYPALAECDCK